jgi:DNA-binding response OmpR family regulator
MAKILIVEDDQSLGQEIVDWLRRDQYTVEKSSNGQDADDLLKSYRYDLVILDWDLPGKPGIQILQRLRESGDKTPVLMLTGKSSVQDRESGLDTGADDYLVKPFHFKELMARVRAALRRGSGLTSNVLTAGAVVLEPSSKRCVINDKEVRLQPKEFALLEFFMRHPQEVFDGNALLDRIWSSSSEATANTVKTYMYTLRKKLAASGCSDLIETVHGSGYRLNVH